MVSVSRYRIDFLGSESKNTIMVLSSFSSVRYIFAIWIGTRVVAQAFTTPMSPSRTVSSRVVPTVSSPGTTRRQALIDPSMWDSIGSINLQPASMDVLTSSLHLAADTAVAAATPDGDDGWWEQYINIFKVGLEFVHGAVDGPLRSVGIEQTWGISIALFTACTYNRCCLTG